ncbi:MAG: hypothetical protein ACRCV0_02095, partial [Brevinema sp.]
PNIFWKTIKIDLPALQKMPDIFKKLQAALADVRKSEKKLFVPPENISIVASNWSREWDAISKFWDDYPPTKGSKELFKKYWTISHEYVKFHGISTYAKKTEICEIQYLMHYMGQGAFSHEYAIKAVEMTKAVMANKLTCNTDDSLKLLIDPSTIYLFKSIDKDAQTKFIELMLQVKNQMGNSFQKFYITSGKRFAIEHTYTVVKSKIQTSGALQKYYGNHTDTGKFYTIIENLYQIGKADLSTVSSKYHTILSTIKQGDLTQALKIAEQLMKDGAFLGTEHNSNSLDFRSNNTSYRLEEIARSNNHNTYSDKTEPFKNMEPHVHILIK